MEKYDMFRLSSAAGQFFIVFGEAPLFSDVQPGAYYYDAVQWAAEKLPQAPVKTPSVPI